MKKFTSILMLAALFCAGCAEDDTTVPGGTADGTRTLTATLQGPLTRTGFGDEADGQIPVNWTKGDQIAVYNMRQKFTFTLDGEGGIPTGTFLQEGTKKITTGVNVRYYYPASVMNASTGKPAALPTTQTYEAKSFDPAACVLATDFVTCGEEKDLLFKPLYAIVCLQLKGDNQKSVNSVAVGMSSGATYTLTCPDVALDTDTATPFYIVLPEGEAELTFTIGTTDGKVKTQATTGAKTLVAGHVLRLPAVTLVTLPKPEAAVSGSYSLATGNTLNTLTLTGTASLDGHDIPGTFAWKNPAGGYDIAGEYDTPWIFTPADPAQYDEAEGMAKVTVTQGPIHVYVSGQGDTGKAMLWKDGVSTLLNGGIAGSNAYSVSASLGKTYAAGTNGSKTPACWIDGEPIVLPTPAGVSGNVTLATSALYTLNGNYFVVGNIMDFSSGKYAMCWMNGELLFTQKSTGVYNLNFSSVYTTDDKIYVAGANAGSAPTVWSKGSTEEEWTESSYLTDFGGIINTICVSDGHVYTAGSNQKGDGNTNIEVRKDGAVITTLGNEAKTADASSIAVVGNDVYVLGLTITAENVSTSNIWKNDQLIELPENTTFIAGMCITGNTIYLTGNISGTQGLSTRSLSGGEWTKTELSGVMNLQSVFVR